MKERKKEERERDRVRGWIYGKHDRHTYKSETYNFIDTFIRTLVTICGAVLNSFCTRPVSFVLFCILTFNSILPSKKNKSNSKIFTYILKQSDRNVFSTYCPNNPIVLNKEKKCKTSHSSFAIHFMHIHINMCTNLMAALLEYID